MDMAADEHLLSAFAAYSSAVSGLAAGTVRNHGIYLRTFLRWWDEACHGRSPTQATTADLALFLVSEQRRGLAARTRRAEAAALRRFYSWLAVTGVVAGNPATDLGTPRATPLTPHLYQPNDVNAILRHTAGLRDLRGRQRHAIVSVLRYTGMRSAELRTLQRSDLDLETGRARVIGKGARSRLVILPAPLVGTLQAFLTEVRPELPDSPLLLVNAHPFVTTALRGYGQEALAREVELAGQGAGIPGRHHPHMWRHTFATELVRRGVDIHVVQRLLGHASIASTVGYTHLAMDDLADRMGDIWP